MYVMMTCLPCFRRAEAFIRFISVSLDFSRNTNDIKTGGALREEKQAKAGRLGLYNC